MGDATGLAISVAANLGWLHEAGDSACDGLGKGAGANIRGDGDQGFQWLSPHKAPGAFAARACDQRLDCAAACPVRGRRAQCRVLVDCAWWPLRALAQVSEARSSHSLLVRVAVGCVTAMCMLGLEQPQVIRTSWMWIHEWRIGLALHCNHAVFFNGFRRRQFKNVAG